MGIKNLIQFLKQKSPNSIQNIKIANLKGKKIAIDSSMVFYQFLTTFTSLSKKRELYQIQDKNGNQTAHIMGMLYRNIFLLKNDIEPIWVFDGKRPQEKSQVCEKRQQIKDYNQQQLIQAQDEQNHQLYVKFAKSSINITQTMIEDSKRLIQLLGLTIVEAPSEAEAQCAYLGKMNYVDFVNSGDTDSLVFGAPKVIKNIKNDIENEIIQINLDQVLIDLQLNQTEFIDFCILLGSDYNQNIYKMGPQTSYKQIIQHRNIENVLSNNNYKLPEYFDYQSARQQFQNHNVISDLNFMKNDYDEEKLIYQISLNFVLRLQNGLDFLKQYYKK